MWSSKHAFTEMKNSRKEEKNENVYSHKKTIFLKCDGTVSFCAGLLCSLLCVCLTAPHTFLCPTHCHLHYPRDPVSSLSDLVFALDA